MCRHLILERQVCSVQGLISSFAALVLVINQTDTLLGCWLRYIVGNLWMTLLNHSISTAGRTLSPISVLINQLLQNLATINEVIAIAWLFSKLSFNLLLNVFYQLES